MKKNNMKKQMTLICSLTGSVLAFAALSGCETKPATLNLNYVTTHSAPAPTTDAQSQQQIAMAAVSVSQSLQELAAIQQAVHPHAPIAKPMNPKQVKMDQLASLNWTGPIEPLLKKIAKVTHYQLVTLGALPSIPIIVSIQAQNQPLATILRNAMFQAQEKADVVVYPDKRVIELRYY